MGLWLHLEDWLERTIDQLFSGRKKRGLQPRLLARGLARLMEEEKRISVSRTYVPNIYQVWLNPEEYCELTPFREALAEELEEYLRRRAEKADYLFLGPVRIEWQEEKGLPYGQYRLAASFRQEVAGDSSLPEKKIDNGGEKEHTMVFQALNREEETFSSPAVLKGELVILNGPQKGQVYRIAESGVTIGRAEDNDVILPDPNVSRHHASIKWEEGKPVLRDENSTNGTLVNGVRVREKTLVNGDHLRLGLTEIQFRMG